LPDSEDGTPIAEGKSRIFRGFGWGWLPGLAHGLGCNRANAGLGADEEAGGAAGVGPVGADVRGLEFGEDFGAGMAEAIASTAGDDCPGGADRGEEFWMR